MKKVLALALSLALIATMAITGTIAYLQDTDEQVNVMTLGRVEIEQHEYERAVEADGTYKTDDNIDNQKSYVLKEFTQNKPLYPAIIPNGGTVNGVTWDYDSVPVRMSQVDSYGGASVFNTPNAVDKFVTVENTGKSDAYVRTLIAFEQGSLTVEEFAETISSEIRADEDGKGQFPWKYGFQGTAVINNNNYYVFELVYVGAQTSTIYRHENGVLPAGDTTYPSLCQVYMAAEAGNDEVEAIDGNKNGTYDILVLSQAVQTNGFANAQNALDTAFGKASAETVAEWFGDMEIPTPVATAAELKAALEAGEDVYLTGDIEEVDANTAITIASGKEVTLNLNGHKISATADKTGNQEIFLVKGTMNVSNGSIEMTAKNNQGWGSMATIFDVTAGGVLNMDGVTANVGGTDMNFVVHLNNWGEATLNMNDCDITATYVGVRAFNSGYDMNNVTIKNSDFHTGRVFWVHNYTTEGKDDSTLNLDIYGNGNTSDNPKPIRFGFDNEVYFDINGNAIA